jgi:ubiquinone/menaquinone biosynthesis C-methylase UbiE
MHLLPSAQAGGATTTAEATMSSVLAGVQWSVDRMLSIGYGVVYDYIFERFTPYQKLQREVLALVASAAERATKREDVRVLDVACGPGNFTFLLAEAGFSAVGLEAYGALVELAREKRRAQRLANLAFRHGDLADGSLRERSFDQVVNIHALYVHPEPERLLREAYRVLKPGGHAIFVNHTRHVGLLSTFGEIKRREGVAAALGCLVWVLPNAIFEATRRRIGPHYWAEEEFSAKLRAAGFTVLETRRTFLNNASVLVWARKDAEA